jgi:hypothetical protein
MVSCPERKVTHVPRLTAKPRTRKYKKGDLPDDKIPSMHWADGVLQLAVTSLEPLDATSGVHQFLLAGEERVASGANLGVDLLAGGAGLERVAAQAFHGHLGIHWVDTFSHLLFLLKNASQSQYKIDIVGNLGRKLQS